MSYALALGSAIALGVVIWVICRHSRPRTRWLIERIVFVLIGVLFGVIVLLSILSVYGEQ